jgi:hypothetical protein
MKQNLTPINSKGQRHGYHAMYSPTPYKLMVRGHRKNNDWIKYVEWHDFKLIRFHIR